MGKADKPWVPSIGAIYQTEMRGTHPGIGRLRWWPGCLLAKPRLHSHRLASGKRRQHLLKAVGQLLRGTGKVENEIGTVAGQPPGRWAPGWAVVHEGTGWRRTGWKHHQTMLSFTALHSTGNLVLGLSLAGHAPCFEVPLPLPLLHPKALLPSLLQTQQIPGRQYKVGGYFRAIS